MMHIHNIFINIIIILLLTNCSKIEIKHYNQKNTKYQDKIDYEDTKQKIKKYQTYIHNAANIYGIDEKLIKAIIQVESAYDPYAISKSNAVGLMQIKASTAGRDVYRLKGKKGQPNTKDLKNAAINIDVGTAYLSILQDKLKGIIHPKTKRYAIIVAYVNGLNTLLELFSINYTQAIIKINTLTPDEFYEHIIKYHPATQAQRYLSKVNNIYSKL